MINIKQLSIYLFIFLMCTGCFLIKKDDLDFELIDNDELVNLPDSLIIFDSTFVDSNIIKPFYPQEEKINDLIEDIAALKAQVRDYDSRIRNWDSSVDIFRKIQYPHLTHEIELTNGTLVNGNIIQENSDRMIVKTQIGQLTIDKSDIATIKNISPNIPEVEFNGDATEEIYSDHRVFTGEIANNGFRRADFVRVIYKLYSEKTELVGIDSTFIDGSKFIYKSGVISDTALEPSSSVGYVVSVEADSSLVRYVTREIKWDVFE
tara:strand:- start:356 stop:1144 length:789 start_codon:yes stop_codon:yes gene_type:complete